MYIIILEWPFPAIANEGRDRDRVRLEQRKINQKIMILVRLIYFRIFF